MSIEKRNVITDDTPGVKKAGADTDHIKSASKGFNPSKVCTNERRHKQDGRQEKASS
jgi:hypothetical protein